MDICPIMINVLYAMHEKIFEVDFVQFAKQMAEIYFRYPDVLQKYTPVVCQVLPATLLKYVLNTYAENNLDEQILIVIKALLEM